MRLVLSLVAALSLSLVPAALTATGPGKLYFQDTVPAGASSSVTVTIHRAASFRVLLRVPTDGRGQLFLTGKTAPRGGPLIDTRTHRCEGAAGSYYCSAAYERLPRGRYTWRIRWVGSAPAHVELTVRW